jgi:UDP-N-acetylglucosamine acyltransferase
MNDYKTYKGNKIHNTALVDFDNLLIGRGNVIGPYAIIAGHAQHSNKKSLGKVIIGNNNIFREFFSIHRPVKKNGVTKIGNNSTFFSNVQINHDCILEDDVYMTSSCILGGHVHVMKGASFGFGVLVHPAKIIGSYSMLGMGCIVTKKQKIEPGKTYVGNPARYIKNNDYGLEKRSISSKNLQSEIKRYNDLYKKIKII